MKQLISGKINILMGIYNCAETLAESLDCLLAQTYQNWQAVLCDDGSGDDTADIAARYVAKYPNHFILLRNDQNCGLNITLNRCLAEADGEYIARMDGDDICSPDRLQTEIGFLIAHPEISFVSCNMNLFDNSGIYKTLLYTPEPTKRSLIHGSQFCHAGCMIRTDVLKAVNGYSEETKYLRVEDYDLWVRLYSEGYKGYNIQKPLYSMRDDRNALKRRSFQGRINESRIMLKAGKIFGMPFYGLRCAAVPIIKWCMPKFVYNFFHKR